MNQRVIQLQGVDRGRLVQGGRRLEYFTIAYNSLEGLIAMVAGLVAGSIALVGFGFDSIIEVTSGLRRYRGLERRHVLRRGIARRITQEMAGVLSRYERSTLWRGRIVIVVCDLWAR